MHYIRPARRRGEQIIEVRLGDVRDGMELDSVKAPDVGFALKTQKFEELANVKLLKISGPRSETAPNNVYRFRIF